MSAIKTAVEAVGGSSSAARICGVSPRAVNKWIAAGKLPRTEYTGETRHAKNLAAAAGTFTSEWLLSTAARAPASLDEKTTGSGPTQ
jgi:hypothetical protein